MIIIDKNRKIKRAAKFAGIFVGIALILILAIVGYQKMNPIPAETLSPADAQKTNVQKQKEITDAVNKANEAGGQNKLSQDEQTKKQQKMVDAVDKANQDTQSVSREEQNNKSRDMFNALNGAKKK